MKLKRDQPIFLYTIRLWKFIYFFVIECGFFFKILFVLDHLRVVGKRQAEHSCLKTSPGPHGLQESAFSPVHLKNCRLSAAYP